ncbi:MAG: DUF434 domain-containing protein [Sedimentisphaerales bacterium]|jgi:hypothetical protein
MPDTRNHRGQNPADAELFAPGKIPGLRLAVADYSLLLTKGYAETSALKLVGDRFGLTQRQRLAVMRSSCSDQNLANRKTRQLDINTIAGQPIAIDGYNLLITIEAAISGGLIFIGRDGCCRDLASIHGTYRKVTETIPAIKLIGNFLHQAGITRVLWLLDSPVSNSGRLKTLIRELAEKNNWQWQIELVTSPDAVLIKGDTIVASSDSIILDGCSKWANLAGEIIKTRIPDAKIIDLTA